VAWLLPELDDGAEPELKPEFELELDEPELDDPELDDPVPEEAEPEPVDPVDPEPVEPELADDPELVEVPVDVEDGEVLCVDPGRASATTPTAATLATVTVVVAERILARPRARSVMARPTRSRSRYSSLM
jgi:hypothetical protein